MKILIPLSLLIVGLAVGYAVGINSIKIETSELAIADLIPVNVQVVHDTIIKTEIVEIETEKLIIPKVDSIRLDTLSLSELEIDTLEEKLIQDGLDSIPDENLNILSDVRLKVIKLPINHLTSKIVSSDSLLKSLIDVKDINKEYMNVEFWESPISFSGYKLSKSKLIVYGLSPQFDYQLFKKSKAYYLKFHSIIYELYETEDFKKFIQTSNFIE